MIFDVRSYEGSNIWLNRWSGCQGSTTYDNPPPVFCHFCAQFDIALNSGSMSCRWLQSQIVIHTLCQLLCSVSSLKLKLNLKRLRVLLCPSVHLLIHPWMCSSLNFLTLKAIAWPVFTTHKFCVDEPEVKARCSVERTHVQFIKHVQTHLITHKTMDTYTRMTKGPICTYGNVELHQKPSIMHMDAIMNAIMNECVN